MTKRNLSNFTIAQLLTDNAIQTLLIMIEGCSILSRLKNDKDFVWLEDQTRQRIRFKPTSETLTSLLSYGLLETRQDNRFEVSAFILTGRVGQVLRNLDTARLFKNQQEIKRIKIFKLR